MANCCQKDASVAFLLFTLHFLLTHSAKTNMIIFGDSLNCEGGAISAHKAGCFNDLQNTMVLSMTQDSSGDVSPSGVVIHSGEMDHVFM